MSLKYWPALLDQVIASCGFLEQVIGFFGLLSQVIKFFGFLEQVIELFGLGGQQRLPKLSAINAAFFFITPKPRVE